jgi:nitrogen-specific signal transduction histidine kinase
MFHAFPIGLLLLDDKGAILDANAAARDLPTGAGDDLKGQDFFQVFEGLEDHQAIFDRFIIATRDRQVHESFDTGLRGGGGHGRLPIQLRMERFDSGDGDAILVMIEIVQAGDDNRNAAKLLKNSVKQLSDIRHDINNPLMGIFGHAELLTSREDLPEGARKSADTIMEQSRKIRDLVMELGRVRDGLKA